MKKLILILLFMSSELLACNLSVDNVSNIIFVWDGLEQQVTGNWQVSRDQTGNNDCRRFHITFTPGNSADFNRFLRLPGSSTGVDLNYNLYSSKNTNNILKDHPFAVRREVIQLRMKRNESSASGTFEAILATPPVISTLPAGTYADQVEMKVHKKRFNGPRTVSTSETVIIETIVPASIELSIVDSGSSFIQGSKNRNINFGELDQNVKTENFDFLIQANSNFIIKASSQNDGELANTSDNSYKIPYTFYVNNSVQSLAGSSGSPIVIGSGSGPNANPDGSRFPARVEISNSANVLSGLYQDSIQITVETTL